MTNPDLVGKGTQRRGSSGMKAAVNVGGVVVELERVESWWGGGWVYSFTLKRDGAAVEYGIAAVSALDTCDAAMMAACSRIHAMGVKAWATSAAA